MNRCHIVSLNCSPGSTLLFVRSPYALQLIWIFQHLFGGNYPHINWNEIYDETISTLYNGKLSTLFFFSLAWALSAQLFHFVFNACERMKNTRKKKKKNKLIRLELKCIIILFHDFFFALFHRRRGRWFCSWI